MIKFNGKDIIPRLNGKELSRVMYNGKQIYPNIVTTDFLEGIDDFTESPYYYINNITNQDINYDNTYANYAVNTGIEPINVYGKLI